MVVLTRSGWVVFYTDRHCGGRVWRVRRSKSGGYEMGMQTSRGWTSRIEYRDQAEHAKAFYQAATTGRPIECPACAKEEEEEDARQRRRAEEAEAVFPLHSPPDDVGSG